MGGLQIESTQPGEGILSQANGTLSVEQATLILGQNLVAMSVLGKITTGGKYKEFDPAAVDGSETAAAILYGEIDATAADKEITIIERLVELRENSLAWKTGLTSDQKAAALVTLAAKFIIAR